jgi:hypothetical protein
MQTDFIRLFAEGEVRVERGLTVEQTPEALIISVASPYLTVEQAALYCRCAVQTIYNRRGEIDRAPGTRKLLFTREALDKWLSRKHKQPSHKRKDH